MKFSEWVELKEGKMRSLESSLKCPYPKNKEFCRAWNKHINEDGPDPYTIPKFSKLKRTERIPPGRPDTTFRSNDGYNRRQGKRVSDN